MTNTSPGAFSSTAKHQVAVSAMFERIAPRYDTANRILSFGVDVFWRRRLVRGVAAAFLPGSRRRILDLAAGTYDVSIALADRIPGAFVLAVDSCLPMLQAGKGKLIRAGGYAKSRIAPIAGDALHLPMNDASVDAVTVSFGLRNMFPRKAALAEAHRVLTPGGVFHILEFGAAKCRICGGLYTVYLTRILPYIGWLVTGDKEAYSYLARTVRDFPAAAVLTEELRAVGFQEVTARRLWGGIAYLHTGKK
ncbi:MAG: ubiquinone/menaquinone biosynthesis methyltransferase [Deltaproteobacteria bacterium]|nr:ubiquinone/menaquinone biosynthesis methyltransferase [Deltaproteobacteria bacterium]